MRYILGIDVGTSNVKVVLFDEAGQEIYVASRESEMLHAGGNHAEQDMNAVWENVKACVKEVADVRAAEAEKIIGVGIAGQGEGCWLVDQNGNPVQNAILWCDGRAVAEVGAVTKEHPEIGKLYHRRRIGKKYWIGRTNWCSARTGSVIR